jgi:hypothetical protein
MNLPYVPASEMAMEGYLPRFMPREWERVPYQIPAFRNTGFGVMRGCLVLFEVGTEEDGRLWAHLSISSGRGTCPTWEQLNTAKRIFLGDDRHAYEVHPPAAEHYDAGLGTDVRHLWAPLQGDPPLPNFLRARGGTGL